MMTIKIKMLTVGIAAAAVLGTIGAASACGCKTKFERTKPHVNVSGSASGRKRSNALKASPRHQRKGSHINWIELNSVRNIITR